MLAKNIKVLLSTLALSSCSLAFAFAQSSEAVSEKKENILEFRRAEVRVSPAQIAYSAGIISGYDSNVLLARDSKGDIFEEVFFSLKLGKQLAKDLKLSFDYNLDNINYNEFTHQSSLINHFRLALHKKLSFLTVGGGHEFAFFYYPQGEDQDFLYHKAFFYIRQDISLKAYQQLQFETGQKDYSTKEALSYTIDTYQDKDQRDKRLGVEYSLGAILQPKLFARLKVKFYKNDSNAKYQNFYDYEVYEFSPFLKYRLRSNLDIYTSFTYIEKDYKSRLVTLGANRQEDIVYGANLGLNYRFNPKNTIFLSYTYRNNSSNDSFVKYTDNIISCGWQYNF